MFFSATDAAAACSCDHGVGADNARGLPDPKLRVDHDAKGLADAFPVEAGGELGVVGDHGVDADEDRVVLVTEAVGVQPRFFAADPARLPGPCRDLAVEAHRELGCDKGTPGQAVLDVKLVQSHGPIFVHAHVDPNARRFKRLDTRAADSLIRISHRDDRPVDA